MKNYELPKLPYEYDGLEPYIDAKTVEIHYTKHHKGYLDKLLNVLQGHEDLTNGKTVEMILSDLNAIPESIRQQVINLGGGYVNHNLYWLTLSPNGGGEPSGNLLQAINDTFGSFQSMKDALTAASVGVFGSGYGWLVVDNNSKKLEIMTTKNQDSPYSFNKTPIAVIDVWEHAYYLEYQNRRPEYVERFYNILNWDEIERRYVDALSK